MTDYKTIFGKKIKFLTSDLDNAEAEGEIFYSDSAKDFKIAIATSAWSAAPILPQVLGATNGAGSSQDAVIIMTGTEPPGNTDSADSYEYNGSGWAAGGSLNVARNGGGTSKNAPLTACLAFAGNDGSNDRSITESYNGTSWTEVGDMNTARREVTGFGISTAAVAAGGATSPQALTEEFDGSSWTESGDLNTGRGGMQASGFGILTSGIVAGGEPAMTNAEQYNGTSWTAIANLSTGVHLASGVGTTSAGKIVGGAPGQKAINQQWDGTSWTEGPDIATARTGGGQGGTNSAGIIAGGNVPAQTDTTEEFNTTVMTRTAGAWTAGGNLGTARYAMGGAGTQTAGLGFGGYDSGFKNESESYDGSSWTEGPNLNTARAYLGGCGTQTAAVGFSGQSGSTSHTANSEEYDGSSWAEGDNVNTARAYSGSFGTQTAAVFVAGGEGVPTTAVANVEEYNGSSWSEVTDVPAAVAQHTGAGILTSGIVAGGSTDFTAPTIRTTVLEYDGTNWTTGGALATKRRHGAAAGASSDSAIVFGGSTPSITALTEGYDGTSWSTRPSLGATVQKNRGTGTVASGLSFGGAPDKDGTQEFTGESTAINLKTITDS